MLEVCTTSGARNFLTASPPPHPPSATPALRVRLAPLLLRLSRATHVEAERAKESCCQPTARLSLFRLESRRQPEPLASARCHIAPRENPANEARRIVLDAVCQVPLTVEILQ